MAPMVLAEQEAICKRCDKPTMEPDEHFEIYRYLDGEVMKILLKCRECGRRSFMIRATTKSKV